MNPRGGVQAFGQQLGRIKVSAANFRNQQKEHLADVMLGETMVVITKHEFPMAVVMSVAEYDRLKKAVETFAEAFEELKGAGRS